MLRTILSRSPTPAIPKTLPAISLLPSYSFSSRRREKSNDGDSDGDDEAGSGSFFLLNDDPEAPPRLLVVQPRLLPESLLRSKLSEALNLANSLEDPRDRLYAEDFASKETPHHLVVQNPAVRSRKADTYFGAGTVENIECHIRALESKGQLDAVFVNTILSGTQQRNLEMAWKKPVLDRVGLIIDIFNAHAKTKEAKLQTELAVLIYRKSRLGRVRGLSGRLAFGTSGETEVVSARGRGSGGRGFISGAGETDLQLQRRRIHEQKNYILSQLKEVRRTRGVQRYARKRHGGSCGQGLATVAVVGYTNAGKSTLVSALSKSDVYSDDRLFATLDPRLRSVVLPSGRKVLLCDTVGFISDLPVQLVEAFHATLEEVVEADLLLHVLDASAPDLDEQRATVLEVLQQIGVSKEKIHNMIEVWNKIDLLDKDKGASGTLEEDEWCCGGAEGCETIPGDDCSSETEEEGFETISGDECPSGGQEQYETISGEECLGGVEEETISEGEDGFNSNQDEHNMASDLSLEENLENIHDQESLEQKGMTDLNISPGVKDGHLEISAVTRIGLRELLNVIDKKLIKQKSFVTKSLGPFDRKWRPSFATDTEKVAQQ